MIHRIDLADLAANPDTKPFARGQLIWTTLGVLLFVLVLLVVRDHRRLQAFTYTAGLAALVLLLLPLMPVLGTTIHGARIWIRLGPLSFQPGEFAKVVLVALLRRLPGAAPRRAGPGRPPVRRASTCPAGATSARSW